jgi:serine/threonine protein phosphatase PrpC
MTAEPAAQPAPDGTCPSCGSPVVAGEQFCEGCGAPLQPAAAEQPAAEQPAAASCTACGGRVAEDGYCEQCGARAVSQRDHFSEQPVRWVGAVCDRGIRHIRNEDAMAVAADPEPGGLAVLVVCDGVSSAPDSDVASLAAAIAARDVLLAARGLEGDGDPVARWKEALVDAVDAANAAASAAAGDRPTANPPSCTFVCGIVDGPLVVTGCVGDSRAYWVPDDGEAVQLTVDDSWAAEQIALGMPREEAESAPRAHAITRWLGRDSNEPAPSTSTMTPDRLGWLVVCSDGLWNYCSDAVALAAVLAEQAGVDGMGVTGVEPAALAGRLVDWANRQGGHDNITVALARISGKDQR